MLLDRALDRSGLRAWLEQQPDGTARLRLVGRLRTLLQRLEISLPEWLDRAALGDDLVSDGEESIRLELAAFRERPRMASDPGGRRRRRA